jgi:hypothetical protein
VTLFGLGSHSGTGEEWATDENALTRAEAQAFKRACSCFGLGRYFYDLPRTWVDLDDHNRPLQVPRLPEWAIPKSGTNGNGNHPSALCRDELIAEIRRASDQIGISLTREVLRQAPRKHPSEPQITAHSWPLLSTSNSAVECARLNRRFFAGLSDASDHPL